MLSVIITSYDSPELAAVHAREAMNADHTPLEVIVVNDGGDPRHLEYLQKLEKKCRLVYAEIKTDIAWNYTGARNLGVYLSTGDFLSIEDTDNIPSKTAYTDALSMFEKHPELGRVPYGRRGKIILETALTVPSSEWKSIGSRPRHDDTVMVRRSTYLKVKGCDERLAGKYAWACSDYRRRLDRAGIKSDSATHHFWSVMNAETKNTEHIRRIRSYENYELASERAHSSRFIKLMRKNDVDDKEMVEQESWKGHIQSPIGILNFEYEYQEL